MSSFSFNCPCCPPGTLLLAVTCPEGVSEPEWRSNWKHVVLRPTCAHCGAVIRVACDGVPVESGGCVSATNVSAPRIDALSVASGPRTGGNSLYVFGSALDVGNLIVKFDGVTAQAVTNRSASQARVVAPIGRYYFTGAASLRRIRLNNANGIISAGDLVRFTNGSTGIVRHADDLSSLWVEFTSLVGPSSGLVNQTLGAPKGAGVVAGATAPDFIPGEGITGLSSGARGTCIKPFGVSAPSTAFVANEIVRGEASGTCARLGATPYSGRVNVTVENEYGQRQIGGTLVGGYTYL